MAGAPTVILGTGLAGLSLARALVRERPGAPVVLVDRRVAWEHDRTWCFWDVGGLPDARLASARWPAWETVGPDGHRARQEAPGLPYVHVPADRFYAAALDALGADRGVELELGARVLGVHEGRRGPVVLTSRGDLEAGVVVDALGGRGPLLAHGERPRDAVDLRQRFLGLEVETEHAVFDPGVATLMDFRLPRTDGAVRFLYVLPFSRTRALVEDTTIGPRGTIVTDAVRRAAMLAHLDEVLGAGRVTVVREERGTLPMTTRRLPARRGPRLFAVGQAAGAARPSSGYAFVRTQRQAAALARTLVHGVPLAALDPPRRRGLDDLFLHALAAAPHAAPAWFEALGRRVPGPVFARFMSDASGVADDARIVRALATPGFMAAMACGRAGAAAEPVAGPLPAAAA